MEKTALLAERESSFVATVQEGKPYRWTALDFSLNLVGTLRLSQITYLPPTSLADVAQNKASAPTVHDDVYSVRAVVRTLTANNKVEDFVVACFPLEISRITHAALFHAAPLAQTVETAATGASPSASATASTASGPSPPPSISALLPQRHDVFDTLPTSFVLPCPTDIANRLNVHIGLDGFTELRVEGPGTVVFSGEEKIGMVGPSRCEYSLY